MVASRASRDFIWRRRPKLPDSAHKDDIWHDPWAVAEGPALSACVDEATAALAERDDKERAARQAAGKQARRPKADALVRRKALVGNLFANVVVLRLTGPSGAAKASPPRLIVNASNRRVTRYEQRINEQSIFRQVSPTIAALEELGFIVWHGGRKIGLRSTIEAGERLTAAFERHGVTLADIGRVPIEDEEFIFLAPRPKRNPDNPREMQRQPPIAYRETAETRRMREEMREINRAFATAAATLHGDKEARPPWRLQRRFSTDNPAAGNQAFNLHGRLYGPSWWQNLKRGERHRLRINGEPVADLDFKNMFARLAYREAKCEPPDGDLYALPGVDPQWREGIKRTFLALIGSPVPLQRLNPEIKKQLPKGMTGKQMAAAIEARHPRIAHLFGTDLGIRLMFAESGILVAVLLALARGGIPALPMHDGLMVPASARDRAKAIMEDIGKRTAGVRLPVEEKPIEPSTSMG